MNRSKSTRSLPRWPNAPVDVLQIARLYHTVRYLKPVQLYGRVWYRYRRSKPRLATIPSRRAQEAGFRPPIEKKQPLICPTRVVFLNQEEDIAGPDCWNNPNKEKLWLYNLHYLDILSARTDDEQKRWQRAFTSRWIAENPPGEGNGWEPYPTSLRIVNWIKWALCGEKMEGEWLDSLAIQVRWLEDRLEWYLLGNHLLANAKALVFAGLFFSGPVADRWLKVGLSIYERELPEQVLSDGGHFERSPMYHSIVLEDLLDIYNIALSYDVADHAEFQSVREPIDKMRNWLSVMTHPDGRLAFFNDTAFGIAATQADIEIYAGRLGLSKNDRPAEGLHSLNASGYVRANRGDMSAILDVAEIGPDYLPGHAHADTLSFELSLGSERVIVNSGTSLYGTSAQRQYERSTAAHSTIEIDGADSSEVWGGFRVARRARVHGLQLTDSGDIFHVSAKHDGYKRLGGNVVHSRSWRIEGGSVTVEDQIRGQFNRAIARFHMGHGVDLTANCNGHYGEIALPSGRKIQWLASTPARIEPSEWHPEFGKTVDTKALVIETAGSCLQTSFFW